MSYQLMRMMVYTTGTPRSRAQGQRDFDAFKQRRLEKARRIKAERAAARKGPAVGALLSDASWIGPKPKD